MSMFLGPIHHIMFKRIKIVNNREAGLIKAAGAKWGDKAVSAIEPAIKEFGFTCSDKPLENQIGDAAIHGWLQNQLNLVMISEAATIAAILKKFQADGEKLIMEHFYNNGKEIAEKSINDGEGEKDNLESARNMLFNNLLERMPCDNTSATIDVSETAFVVERNLMCNAEFWIRAGAGTDSMINANEAWIRGFVNGCGNFKLEREKKVESGSITWKDTVSIAD